MLASTCLYSLYAWSSFHFLLHNCHTQYSKQKSCNNLPSYPPLHRRCMSVAGDRAFLNRMASQTASGCTHTLHPSHLGIMPSVICRCRLGIRNSIRPVKKLSDEVLAELPVWSEMQTICVRSSSCHCHPIISSLKSRLI